MILIVGLGNPGKKFENTRHNAGFMAVDFFAKKNSFPEFELSKKYESLVSKKGDIMLAKPQTFMNESGRAIKAILKNSKEALVVAIHDDIDLPIGKLKIVKERGSAGHKGIESIVKNVGNEGLVRFRLGIQPENGKPKNREGIVIKKFTKKEMDILITATKKTTEALDTFIKEGLQKAMNKFN